MFESELYYVYIIANAKGSLYTGMTCNINNRLNYHNWKKVVTTKHRGPWKLMIYEICSSRELALKREKYWKSGSGRQRRNKILDNEEIFPYEFKN